ncbi:MAG: sulfite exporter TauE/SafE family protein [Bacteroidota bacterium]
MEASLPLMFAGLVGLGHAFEADHLLAVSNIVTKRENLKDAARDGMFWGLGHTTTIVLIGIVIIVGKVTLLNGFFSYFEALVGFMLVALGVVRMGNYLKTGHATSHSTPEVHTHPHQDRHSHKLAYGVGLIHGLAGSGTMVLLVMSNIPDVLGSLTYLVIFGLGSVLGMLLAAGVLSLPFSRKLALDPTWKSVFVWISSVLCILYGSYVMWENLMG